MCSQFPPTRAKLSGVIADPTGARVFRAKVRISGSSLGGEISSDLLGRFNFEVAPGTYTLTITFPTFEPFEKQLVLAPGEQLVLPVVLSVAKHREEVIVPTDPSSATDPGANLGALTFKGEDLAMFSDDDSLFQRQLSAIAGGSDAFPPQIYVDGFSNGRVPPKNTVREVRINQNPISAQYDRDGLGRIDILTKPGTDKLHGDISLAFNNQALNARNPYTGAEPPYHSTVADGSIDGPLGKKTSFFLSGNRGDNESNAVINAVTLDSNNNPMTLSQALAAPITNDRYTLRLDREITPTNTLSARFEYFRQKQDNAGLNVPLTLPEAAYNNSVQSQTLQISDTQAINAKTVSETRFQYIRTRTRQTPASTAPALIVQGAFNGGGSAGQQYSDHGDRYEFQEYMSFDRGSHLIRAGVRYRVFRNANLSTADFNGEYTFPDITAYQHAKQSMTGATQFNITTGQPSAQVLTGDLGAYVEDDWKLRRDLTLSLGARFESQLGIPDHFDPAPRIGLSWAVRHGKGKTPVLVLRPGFAMFYDRFDAANILQSVRQNGTNEQAYYVQDPTYCAGPPCPGYYSAQQPTTYRIDPNLRSQYDIAGILSAEHTFGRHGSISGTYAAYHGAHRFLLRNANAPLPGTFTPGVPNSGTRPLGGTENIYQYSSNGNANIQLFSSTANFRPAKTVFLTAFYMAQRNLTDSGGPAAFVSNSYDVRADYGRSGIVNAQRLFVGGQWKMPLGFSLASFVNAHSGLPFNITTGSDLNGDTIYNDRPAFATDTTRASVQRTAFGTFDTAPLSTQAIIPVNFGNSPSYVSWNSIFNTTIKVGPRRMAAGAAQTGSPGTAERPFMLGLAVEADNMLNHVNPGTPVGVLSSPLFGKSVSLADSARTSSNRTINLRAFFTF